MVLNIQGCQDRDMIGPRQAQLWFCSVVDDPVGESISNENIIWSYIISGIQGFQHRSVLL